MRFLADENIAGRLVEALRRAGHDVTWARVDCPGADDRAVLARGVAEQRIEVTFDKDFGELAARSGLSAPSGVILIRLPLARPAEAIPRIATLIDVRPDWAGHLGVVEPGRIRMRRLA
jgi:predicted nuclease of predicted toxin-antitoxin system